MTSSLASGIPKLLVTKKFLSFCLGASSGTLQTFCSTGAETSGTDTNLRSGQTNGNKMSWNFYAKIRANSSCYIYPWNYVADPLRIPPQTKSDRNNSNRAQLLTPLRKGRKAAVLVKIWSKSRSQKRTGWSGRVKLSLQRPLSEKISTFELLTLTNRSTTKFWINDWKNIVRKVRPDKKVIQYSVLK